MGCTIEVVKALNGKDSKLYADLLKTTSAERALAQFVLAQSKDFNEWLNAQEKLREHSMRDSNGEVLAEYIGAYKNEISKNTVFKLLPQFETHRDQLDGIDHLTRTIVSELRDLGYESTFGTLNAKEISTAHIAKAIDKTSEKLSTELARVEQLVVEAEAKGDDVAKETNAYIAANIEALINTMTELVMVNEHGHRGPVSLALKQLGVNTMQQELVELYLDDESILPTNESEQIRQEFETEYDKIYSNESIDYNPKDTISSIVKTSLYQLNEVAEGITVDNYTEDSIVPTNYGTPRRANTAEVIQYLMLNVQGVENVAEMMTRLEELQITNPQLIPLVKKLQNEDATMTNQGEVKLLQNAFFTTFSNAYYDMVTITESNGKVSVVPTNRFKTQNLILSDWASKSQAVINQAKQNLPGQAMYDMLSKNKAESLSRLNKFYSDNKGTAKDSELNNQDNKSAPILISDFLAELGIHMSPKAIEAWRADVGDSFAQESHEVLHHLVKGFWTDSDMFNYGVSRTSERKSLTKLTQYEAKTRADVAIGSFLSGTGSQVYAINKPHEAIDVINRLRTNKDGTLDTYSDEVMSNLSVVRDLKNGVYGTDNSIFKVATFDTLYNNQGAFGNGKKYAQMSTTDAVASMLNLYFDNASNKQFGYFFGPNPSDRGRNAVLQMKKKNVDEDGSTSKAVFLTDFGTKKLLSLDKDTEVYTWLKETVQAEVLRALRIRQEYNENIGTDNANLLQKNYHTNDNGELGNGGYINLFPGLNKHIMTEEFLNNTYTNLGASTEMQYNHEAIANAVVESIEFHNSLSDIMIEEYGRDMEYMTSLGVTTMDANMDYAISQSMASRVGMYGKASSWDFQNMFANQMISNYEQTLLYVGDMAYFAPTDFMAETVDQSKQIADLNKRMALPFTPGSRIAAGKPTAIIKVMSDHRQDSDIMDQVEAMLGKNKKAYEGVEIADGQGWVGLHRMKNDILDGQGKLTPQIEAAINRLLEGGKDITDISVVMNIVKGFYYSQEDVPMLSNPGRTTKVPMNLKYSALPAIPALMEEMTSTGKPKYQALYEISQELNGVGPGKSRTKHPNSADEVVMATSVKVGQYNISKTSADLATTPGITIQNDRYRIPMEVNYKTKTQDNFGSQMRKLIEGNFKSDIDVMGMSAVEASAIYNDILSGFTEVQADMLMDEFLMPNGQVNYDAMAENVVSFAEENNASNLDFIVQAMEKHSDGRTKMTLNHPAMRKAIESAIGSAFRNRVTRQSLPGHSAVQITSYGMSVGKAGISGDSSLRMIRLSKDNKELSKANNNMDQMDRFVELVKLIDTAKLKGEDTKALVAELQTYKTEAAEVKVTAQYFIHSLEAKAKKDGVEVQEYLDLITKTNAKGETVYDIEAIKKHGLDEIVLYRIPTQAKNSMLSAKIVEFLPPNAGSAIAVPPGIVAQSGSDFDVDKVYIEMANFYVKGKDLKKVEYIVPGKTPPKEHITVSKDGSFQGDFMFGLKEVNPNTTDLRENVLYSDNQGNTYSIAKPVADKGILQERIESTLAINELNPNSQGISVVGYYTENGIPNPIFRQNKVKGVPANQTEIDAHFKSLGFKKHTTKHESSVTYSNDNFVVSDVSTETTVVDENGNVTIVDAYVEVLKAPTEKVKTEKETLSEITYGPATKSVIKHLGDLVKALAVDKSLTGAELINYALHPSNSSRLQILSSVAAMGMSIDYALGIYTTLVAKNADVKNDPDNHELALRGKNLLVNNKRSKEQSFASVKELFKGAKNKTLEEITKELETRKAELIEQEVTAKNKNDEQAAKDIRLMIDDALTAIKTYKVAEDHSSTSTLTDVEINEKVTSTPNITEALDTLTIPERQEYASLIKNVAWKPGVQKNRGSKDKAFNKMVDILNDTGKLPTLLKTGELDKVYSGETLRLLKEAAIHSQVAHDLNLKYSSRLTRKPVAEKFLHATQEETRLVLEAYKSSKYKDDFNLEVQIGKPLSDLITKAEAPTVKRRAIKPGKAAQQNFVTDYHKATLNHPANFYENIAPNNFETLTKIAEASETKHTNYATLRTQESLRTNNKSGKDLIGFASLSSVGYAIAPKLGLHFKEDVMVLGKPVVFTEEAQLYDFEGSPRYVSKDIEEVQNAAVDNVKNPALGKLNITNYTAPAVMLMIQGRSNLKNATKISNNEVIRVLNNEFESNERLYSAARATRAAIQSTEYRLGLTAKGGEVRIEAGRVLSESIKTAKDLDAALVSKESTLDLFLYYNSHGKELYDAYVALNDSAGARSTAYRNKTKYDKLADIEGTATYQREKAVGSSKTETAVVVSNEIYTRDSAEKEAKTMYLFTDNTERTSNPDAMESNIGEGWYFQKYSKEVADVMSYGTPKNPTSAVIRGLDNAYPISTMFKKGVQWKDDQFDLFKKTIDDEIKQIKDNSNNFKSIKVSGSRIGQGGKFAKIPARLQTYLDGALAEIGIDNTGATVKSATKAPVSNRKGYTRMSKSLGTSNLAVQEAMYNEHHSSSYEENGLGKPMDVLRKTSTSVADSHLQALDAVAELVFLKDSDKTEVLYAWDTYLASNSEATSIQKTQFAEMMEDAAGVREMFLPEVNNDNTLAAQLQLYRDFVIQFQKIQPNMKLNKMVEHLKSKDSTLPNGTKIRTVAFNSAVLKAASKEEVMEISDSIEELLEMTPLYDAEGTELEVTLPTGEVMGFSEYANQLGINIAAYNFIVAGMGKKISSYSELMPFSAHEQFSVMYEDYGINTVEFFRELEINSDAKINDGAQQDFAVKFLQHNPDRASWMGSKSLVEIVTSMPTVEQTMGEIVEYYRDDTRRVIYEVSNEKGMTRELPYLGEGGLFLEYGASVPAFQTTPVSGVAGVAKAYVSDVANHVRVDSLVNQKSSTFNEQLANLNEQELVAVILKDTVKGQDLYMEIAESYRHTMPSIAEVSLNQDVVNRINKAANGKDLASFYTELTKAKNC